VTPFAAAGLLHATGSGDSPVEAGQGANLFHSGSGAITWLQLAVGFDSQSRDGRLVYRFETGWVVPLHDEGLQLVDGNPTDADWKAIRLVTRGKLVLGGSSGWAF
jgi:hypothetical protein